MDPFMGVRAAVQSDVAGLHADSGHYKAPKWVPDRRELLFLQPEQESLVAQEQFRTLRSRLQQIRKTQTLKTLLIASAMPSEGKTFVASNLALIMVRQCGLRVLLIDGDLRSPRLHDVFEASRSPGLIEYLGGHVDETSAIQRAHIPNLYLMTGGNAISNPAGLMGNGRLETLITRIAPTFDWIIVDSPPAVPVADASLIAEACDGVVLVLRSGSTRYDLAQKAYDEFRRKTIVGAVLNRVEARAAHGACYYNSYGNPKK
jgi:protein-tyrosine kinase